MSRNNRKLISFFLSLVIIFGCLPKTVIALDLNTETVKSDVETISDNYEEETVISNEVKDDEVSVKEVVALRDESVKHFDMGDGTYQAVTYGYPVHRKDAIGKWQDIDNSLITETSKGIEKYSTRDSRVKFASQYSPSASLMTFSENGYTIEMSLITQSKGVASSTAKVNNSIDTDLSGTNSMSRDIINIINSNLKSSIKYDNIVPNVDLEYVLHSNNIKENIVINDICDNYSYTFKLKLNNLSAALGKDNVIYLCDMSTGRCVYTIPAPYMYDAGGDVSYDVTYKLKETENGIYQLTITANDQWINKDGRKFPVTVDPTLSSHTDYTDDTYVNDLNDTTKNTNYGHNATVLVGTTQTAFIKSWGMPDLPQGATVTNATLNVLYYFDSGVMGGMYITAHVEEADWDEYCTWNDMSYDGQDSTMDISPTVLSSTYLGANTFYPQLACINITSAAQSWYNGNIHGYNNNYGIALKRQSGNSLVYFHSSEANNGFTPYFSITYIPVIQAGVYSLSKQNTTSYARCNTVNGGTYLSQQTFTSVPANESVRYAMFKFNYRADTDDYVIRNMVNNEVIIYANVRYDAPLTEKMKNVNDADIATDMAWKITKTEDGFYYIFCKIEEVTYYMCMPSSGNLELTTDKNVSGTKWNFHRYTGATFRGWGQIDEWPEHIENGTSATIEAYIYSTVIGENRAWFIPSSIDADVATATRSSYSAQMTITPKYGGNTKIRIEANGGTAVFGYHYLMSGWDTGSFFIKNKYTSQYLTLIEGTSDPLLWLTDLPDGHQNEYTLWNMVHWSGGYYKIVQDVSEHCIFSNNNTSYYLYGSQMGDEVWQQILWKFIPQSDGTVKIQSNNHEINNPNNFMSLEREETGNIKSLAGTGDKQLWILTPAKFNIKILYDQAFVDKYSATEYMEVLNHTFGNNSINNSIGNAIFEQLGIRFSWTFESTPNNTFASYPYYKGCLECDDLTTFCENHYSDNSQYTCSTSGQTTISTDCVNGLHHKRWGMFDDNISASSSYIPILFTGHTGCSIDSTSGEHVNASVAGYANYLGGTCIVILSQGGVSSSGDESARLLLHEMMHILYVEDNTQEYNKYGHQDYDPTKVYRMNCVMGFNRRSEDVQQNLTICDYCKNVAKLHKYSFYNH